MTTAQAHSNPFSATVPTAVAKLMALNLLQAGISFTCQAQANDLVEVQLDLPNGFDPTQLSNSGFTLDFKVPVMVDTPHGLEAVPTMVQPTVQLQFNGTDVILDLGTQGSSRATRIVLCRRHDGWLQLTHGDADGDEDLVLRLIQNGKVVLMEKSDQVLDETNQSVG